LDVSVERCIALGALGYLDAWRNDRTLRRCLPRRSVLARMRMLVSHVRLARVAMALLAPGV
jgi:hypothetical protein